MRSILADSLEGFVDALPKFTLAGKKLPRSITGIDGNQSFRLQIGFPVKMNNDEHTLQPAT